MKPNATAVYATRRAVQIGKCFGRIPRPKGEGGAKHRVRGAEKILFTRHPAGCKIFTLTHGGPLCIIIRLGA
jgi:hypothetical protein